MIYIVKVMACSVANHSEVKMYLSQQMGALFIFEICKYIQRPDDMLPKSYFAKGLHSCLSPPSVGCAHSVTIAKVCL